jgi:hypothetical protein
MKDSPQSPEVGQYEYADFADVLNWVRHFTNVYGPQLAVAFDRYIRLREYYLGEKKNLEAARTMECLIKNDVGVRRLREDCPHFFTQVNSGRQVEFYEGKFLGWGDELVYDPYLKAVCAYEI